MSAAESYPHAWTRVSEALWTCRCGATVLYRATVPEQDTPCPIPMAETIARLREALAVVPDEHTDYRPGLRLALRVVENEIAAGRGIESARDRLEARLSTGPLVGMVPS